MTVLDAYAVVAYLRGERCADDVAALPRAPTALTAANTAEVLDQLVLVCHRDPDNVHADLELLEHSGMELLPVTPDLGFAAGRLRAKHYNREHTAVSLADCIAAPAALTAQRPLWPRPILHWRQSCARKAARSTVSPTATVLFPDQRPTKPNWLTSRLRGSHGLPHFRDA